MQKLLYWSKLLFFLVLLPGNLFNCLFTSPKRRGLLVYCEEFYHGHIVRRGGKNEPLIRNPSIIVDTIDWRLCFLESAETFWNQRMPGSWWSREPRLSAPQSTATSAAGIHATFIFIYLWWILWISRCRTRRSSFVLLALGWGGYFVFVSRVLTWLLTWFFSNVQRASRTTTSRQRAL